VTSSDRTALGDRMKGYERATRTVLPRRTYTLIRVDGRAFHSYLRGAAKPYDYDFMADMDAVAEALCSEISGSVFAFTQSDEISVLAIDFGGPNTQPWFAGEVQKVVSSAAALASVTLCRRRPGAPTFDARAFTLADPVEVANYFIWRQRDCVRNSITMAAQAVFSHRRLHGVNGTQMQELLFAEAGINWNDYPPGAKRGRVAVRHSGEREVTFTDRRTEQEQTVVAMRSWWATESAPHFTTDAGGFLATTIPPLPSLHAVPAEEAA
jgi:tRNA(His) guanylyltransferase